MVMYLPRGKTEAVVLVDAAGLTYDQLKVLIGAAVKKMGDENPHDVHCGVFILGYAWERHIIERDFSNGHIWIYGGVPEKFWSFLRGIMPSSFLVKKVRDELRAQLCVNAA